ncbi:MAG TPA: glycosyltransferase, partial [Roseivirga sp.]
MQLRKTKVFIGALLNSNWSLDWNAKTIAKFINKDLFEVTSMSSYKDATGIEGLEGVKLLKRYYPDRLWIYICYLRGIFWADVVLVYRPKEHLKFYGILKMLNRKTIRVLGSSPIGELRDKSYKRSLFKYTHLFALSRTNQKACRELNIPVEDRVLPNPIDLNPFLKLFRERDCVKTIAFIGNNFAGKRIEEFIWLAQEFPQLNFQIIGGYEKDVIQLKNSLDTRNKSNIQIIGLVGRERLQELLENVDLHILPSRVEGRPKVIFECGAMGIPSIVFKGYGAEEYIINAHNGFLVDTREEMRSSLESLLNDRNLLTSMSNAVFQMVKPYNIDATIHL